MTRELWTRALRRHRTFVLMAFDGLALLASYLMSLLLRYDSAQVTGMLGRVAAIAAAAVAIQFALGMILRIYSGRVAVASIEETILLGLTTVGGGTLLSISNMFAQPLVVARSLPFAATFTGLIVMVVGRALWRQQSESIVGLATSSQEPVLLVGAGWSGNRLADSMMSQESPMWPIGFLDDDAWMRHRKHHGLAVLGTVEDLGEIAQQTDVRTVVIAIPSASPELVKRVSDAARELHIGVKVLPPLHETFEADIDIKHVRDIEVRDLLGRPAIETNIASIAGYLTGKRILVTGAGGSIGSELCRQIDRWSPAELILLDRDESALHAVQLSLRGHGLLDSPDVVLNDIRDEPALREIFMDRRPQVVFHTAALKHLPMLEQYPVEAMKTNVLGTANVLAAAAEVAVEHFVNISTDKAADPTSVLGYSKRISERLTADVARQVEGAWISVRFGNVLGSRGSVLTSFAAQIAAGGPVTVTDPDVTRYFMTVEEAVQLVIQAGAIGQHGEVLILDMGDPVRIEDVARQLIEQSGKPVEIVYTGLRAGEKLHERLFGEDEADVRSEHPLISHVPVPALAVTEVRSLSMDVRRVGMLRHFEQWTRLGAAPVVAVHAVVPGVRGWRAPSEY